MWFFAGGRDENPFHNNNNNNSHNNSNAHSYWTTSRKQQLQFLAVTLCLICLLPTRLVWKSQKWQFPISFSSKSTTSTSKTRVNNHTAECRYFPEAIFQFTNELHDHPETTALRVWQLHSAPKYPTWHFPGLSSQLLEQSLAHKRTILTGDSTLFYLMRWMQTLLVNLTIPQQDGLRQLALSVANYQVNPKMEDQVGWSNEAPAMVETSDYQISWHGYRGADADMCDLDSLFRTVQDKRPHIWMVNVVGLHSLHFMGQGRDVPLCAIDLWLNYEQVLQRIVDVAHDTHSVRLVLFKTTNHICTSQFRNDYADALDLYRTPRSDAFRQCEKIIHDMIPRYDAVPHIFDKTNITRYCQKAVMDEFGVQDLNHRLLQFVQSHQSQKSNLTIAIFNDHDTQLCAYSSVEDGRHYHPLNLMRIRLLANMIQCLYHE